jgi:hypothetical protein
MLDRLGQRLPGLGICGLITGAAAAPASAMALFPEDFRHHARFGVCPGLGEAPTSFRGQRRAWMSQAITGGRRQFGRPRRSTWVSC